MMTHADLPANPRPALRRSALAAGRASVTSATGSVLGPATLTTGPVAKARQAPPVALTIAGSDSGGGAGIQADLKTFAAFGVFGTSVLTAVTAQNTRGVDDVHVLPTDAVQAQLDAVTGDFTVAAVKTGMLANTQLVDLVGRSAAQRTLPQLVVDPVLVAASGDRLIVEEAVARYRDVLFEHAAVVTPNVPEAEVLTGRTLKNLDDVESAARELADDGPEVVVIKGGHLTGDLATDVVVQNGEVQLLSAARIDTANIHGTGCTFAAAITASLAQGAPVGDAIADAKTYVWNALLSARHWNLGAGSGPLDHGVNAKMARTRG